MEEKKEEKNTETRSEQQTAPNPTVNITIQQQQHQKRIGKKRSIFAPLLLPIITLGIYSWVWIYKLYKEADLYCEGKVKITSGVAAIVLLLIPVFNIVWAIMLWFKTPGLLTKMQIADGIPQDKIKHYGNYGWFALVPIVGWIIWIILTQSAFNQYWDKVRTS